MFNFLQNKKSKDKDEIVWSKPKNVIIKDKKKGFFSFKNNNINLVDLKKSRKKVLKDIKNESLKKDSDSVVYKSVVKKTLDSKKEINKKKIDSRNKVKISFINKYLARFKKNRKDFYKIKNNNGEEDEDDIVIKKIEKKDTIKEKKTESKERDKEVNKWEKVDTLDTNLIKGEFYIFFDWQKNVIYLMIGILISSIMLSGVYFSISYIEESKSSVVREYTEEIREIRLKVLGAEKEIAKINNFGSKIELAKEVLDSHIYWSNFFTFLEENTLSNVYYSGFAGNTGGVYNLSARTNSFDTLYAQILHLKNNPDIFEIKTENGNRVVDTETEDSYVEFNLNLKINPRIFYQ